MARDLKSNLKELMQVFAKDQGMFRIIKASADELKCKFYLKNETFFDIQAHIPETYPTEPPLWLVDNVSSENEEIINALDEALKPLNETKGAENLIKNQVKMLIHLLCRTYDEPLPEELDQISSSTDQESTVDDTHSDSDRDTGNESEDDTMDSDEGFELDEDDKENPNLAANEMDAKNAAVIKKQQDKIYENHQKQSSSANSSTNKILLTELEKIYHSDVFKNQIYTVELVDDSLYIWKVNLMSVCSESLLQADLNRLKAEGSEGSIEMRIIFKETFPFDPPFIQVTYPAINGGHVLEAGALCMELLTKQGWSSAYSMENVLMQISSTFITGNARVNFKLTKVIENKPHSLEQAKRMFAHHEEHHAKNGWATPANQNS